ncbi:MAG: hypothetical protein ACK5SI_04865 [Planctomycetia bacterium]
MDGARATARTDAHDGFTFGRLDLDSYRVVVTAAGGRSSVTSRTVTVTRGGEIRGLDVGLTIATAPTPAPRPATGPTTLPAPRPPAAPGRSAGRQAAAFASLAVGSAAGRSRPFFPGLIDQDLARASRATA